MWDWFARDEQATGAPPAAEETARPASSTSPTALAAVARIMAATCPEAVLQLPVDQPPPPAMIKRAYKAACLEVHPDRCQAPGAEDAFKRVAAAYDALANGGPWERLTVAQQPSGGHGSRSRHRNRPPGSTSGARWGHGASAHRGNKPPNWNNLEPQKPTHRKGANLPKKAGLPPRPSSPAKAPKVWSAMPPGEAPRPQPRLDPSVANPMEA